MISTKTTERQFLQHYQRQAFYKVAPKNHERDRNVPQNCKALSQVISPPLVPYHDVVQTDDGKWSIGWHNDAPGPFESRAVAAAVAAKVPA